MMTQQLKRYNTLTVISNQGDLRRDVQLKAKTGQPGITKEDLRQLARLGNQHCDESETAAGSKTMVKRIRQWGLNLGPAFLARRSPDHLIAQLQTASDPAERPQDQPGEENLLRMGSTADPASIANQLSGREAKERLRKLYDKYGIPEWLGIHPQLEEEPLVAV